MEICEVILAFSYLCLKKRARIFVPTLNDATGNLDVGRCIRVTPRILNLKKWMEENGRFRSPTVKPPSIQWRGGGLGHRIGLETTVNEKSMTPGWKQTRSNQEFSPYTDWATSTNRTVLMSSSTASFRNIYIHVGNSITISTIDKVSLNKKEVKKLEINK